MRVARRCSAWDCLAVRWVSRTSTPRLIGAVASVSGAAEGLRTAERSRFDGEGMRQAGLQLVVAASQDLLKRMARSRCRQLCYFNKMC